MGSFLKKIKSNNLAGPAGQNIVVPQKNNNESISQLSVDVYRSEDEIVIYAQVSGVETNKIDVSIEGDNDIVTIQGEQMRPEDLMKINSEPKPEEGQQNNEGENVQINVNSSSSEEQGKFLFKECVWGRFFRQIVLPQEIDPERASAKTKDGVLVLNLPIRRRLNSIVKLEVVKFEEHHHEG